MHSTDCLFRLLLFHVPRGVRGDSGLVTHLVRIFRDAPVGTNVSSRGPGFGWLQYSFFDSQSRFTPFAAVLLALITLLTRYVHVDLLVAAAVDRWQQAGFLYGCSSGSDYRTVSWHPTIGIDVDRYLFGQRL